VTRQYNNTPEAATAMATVHVGYSNDTEAEFELSQFESMLFDRRLPSDAIYWIEGMAEWKSIADYVPTARRTNVPVAKKVNSEPAEEDRFDFGSDDESDDASTSDFGGRSRSKKKGYRYVNNPKWLTMILVITLIGTVGLLIADTWAALGIMDAVKLNRRALPERLKHAGLIDIMLKVGVVLSGLVFFTWVFRASDNSHGFGAKRMQYSPGWAVGSWFIPIANLVWPYQAIKEVYLVSRDPKNWKKDNVVSIVEFWWIIRMLSVCTVIYNTMMLRGAKTQQEIMALLPVVLAVYALAFMRICLEITMICKIARQQDMLVNPDKYDKEKLTAIEMDIE